MQKTRKYARASGVAKAVPQGEGVWGGGVCGGGGGGMSHPLRLGS